MKHNKKIFNLLLIKYNKYIAKLNRFQLTGKNTHRQNVLKKHIEKLRTQLYNLFASIQKVAAFATLATTMAFMAPDATAQTTFAPAQIYPFNILDTFFSSSAPIFVDLDNDGDFDILISGHIGVEGFFKYLKNSGTLQNPTYDAPVTNPFNLTNSSSLNPKPTFIDIDNDGDLDLFVGVDTGNFDYYENIGTPSAPLFGARQTNPFGITQLSYSAPTFSDLDNDGDFDLIAGNYYGNFFYFENTGTPSAPSFGSPITNPFGLTDIGYASTPALIDFDNDGDFDLFSGDANGNFRYFKNSGTNLAPNFDAVQTNPFSLTQQTPSYTTISMADIDNDGDLDLISGEVTMIRNLFYYENTSPTLSITDTVLEKNVLIFPNPASNSITIEINGNTIFKEVIIYDILGKQILSSKTNKINITNLESGTYLLKIIDNFDTTIFKRIVKK